MTATTNAGFDTAAAAAAVGLLYLVEMEFAGGTLYLTTWPHPITVGAQVYTGLGHLGTVGQLKESEDGQTQTVDLELSQVSATNLSLALGSVSSYQGRAVRVYQALTDAHGVIQGAPVLRFAGWMDQVKIPSRGEAGLGKVVMACKTGGYDLRRNPIGLRMNDSQHQARYPGELGFQYVPALIAQPQLWLSKNFQRIAG